LILAMWFLVVIPGNRGKLHKTKSGVA